MKLKHTVAAVLFITIISIVLFYNNKYLRNIAGRLIARSSENQTKQISYREYSQLSEVEMARLEEGDIIMRRGFGKISDFILKYFSGEIGLTHCGVLTLKADKWYVINCESNENHDGMQLVSLGRFLKDSYPQTIAVVRLNKEERVRTDFLYWMKYYLGQQTRFDYKFDDKDSSEFYCTEVIDIALQKALGKRVLTQRKNMGLIDAPTYENFFLKEHFQIIINQASKDNL
ncbi:MAG: hypothetical protein J5I91_02810 [Bacteroidetes bacterium]|nr:hypothetical protein [Bacteroidota bacterium]